MFHFQGPVKRFHTVQEGLEGGRGLKSINTPSDPRGLGGSKLYLQRGGGYDKRGGGMAGI